jgi:hypothetical protein
VITDTNDQVERLQEELALSQCLVALQSELSSSKSIKIPDPEPLDNRTKPPPPIQVDGHKEWEVDHVLAVRLRRGKLQYRVQWLP